MNIIHSHLHSLKRLKPFTYNNRSDRKNYLKPQRDNFVRLSVLRHPVRGDACVDEGYRSSLWITFGERRDMCADSRRVGERPRSISCVAP